jgi:hypothetical protein
MGRRLLFVLLIALVSLRYANARFQVSAAQTKLNDNRDAIDLCAVWSNSVLECHALGVSSLESRSERDELKSDISTSVPPTTVKFRQVSVGKRLACAVDAAGFVWCWGHAVQQHQRQRVAVAVVVAGPPHLTPLGTMNFAKWTVEDDIVTRSRVLQATVSTDFEKSQFSTSTSASGSEYMLDAAVHVLIEGGDIFHLLPTKKTLGGGIILPMPPAFNKFPMHIPTGICSVGDEVANTCVTGRNRGTYLRAAALLYWC